MSKLLLQAPAKINLGLEILRKRTDGYHDIKTVFCSVSLYDVIEITRLQDDRIIVNSLGEDVPKDEGNTVYKVLKLLGIGAEVYIKKNIPVKAGLGGGSGDAGAILKYFGRGDLALEIGSDVPYFIKGGTQIGEGRGEILTELPSLAGIDVVICVPEVGVETGWAYQNVDYNKINSGKIDELIKEVSHFAPRQARGFAGDREKNLKKICDNLHNDFEYWVLPKYPEILKVKEDMVKYGARGALMTGSGSGVFGICGDEGAARGVYEKMRKQYRKTYLTKIL